MASQPPSAPRGRLVAGLITAVVVIAAPITATQEGFVPRARPDPAHIPTFCFGETQNVDPERVYTRGECVDLLRVRLARDYAPAVLACLPQLAEVGRQPVFVALLDASYNAGPKAVCASPMARQIRAGHWRAACNGFRKWYISALNRKTGKRIYLKGLVKRRAMEAQLCLKGVPKNV